MRRFARSTPLGLAVKNTQVNTVRLLLEQGADMEAVPYDDSGSPVTRTLIHLASELGRSDIVALLLQAKLFLSQARANVPPVPVSA